MSQFGLSKFLKLSKKDITSVVLVVGDPGRTETVAKMCDFSKVISCNREYKSVKCVKNDHTFLVVSHGIGSTGAAICFEELIKLGAKTIVRAGTAGSLSFNLNIGDIVICEGAVRDDGASSQYMPHLGFPAVCDFHAYRVLVDVAEEIKVKYHSGLTYTSDTFYKSKLSQEKLDLYAHSNVSIVEMEVAILFLLGKLRGIRTAALCTVDGSPFSNHINYDAEGSLATLGKERMLNVAIAACVKFTEQHE